MRRLRLFMDRGMSSGCLNRTVLQRDLRDRHQLFRQMRHEECRCSQDLGKVILGAVITAQHKGRTGTVGHPPSGLHTAAQEIARRRAPWSAVRSVHLAGRVVHHRCQGHADGLLFMSPPLSASSAVCDAERLQFCPLNLAINRDFTQNGDKPV